MYIHPRLLKNWDWLLMLFTAAIVGVGLVVLSSALTGWLEGGDPKGYLIRQGAAVGLGLAAWLFFALMDYSELRSLYWVLYGLNVLMLLLVLLIGIEQNGSKSWLDLKVITIQPAELSKVLLILTLSKQLEGMDRLDSWLHLTAPVLHVLPIMGLVLLQGDFGTAMVLAGISVVLVYCAGFPGWKILGAALVAGALVGGLVFSHYRFGTTFPLKPYQWTRIDTFLYPEKDPTDGGWQVIQSKVAIGSGGMWGRGLGEGKQNHLGWLPYPHTDFVFSVIAEELGFVGGAMVIALYGLIFFRIGSVAQHAKDRYGSLLCVGTATFLGVHVLENVGMTMGVTPVTGIPLPFISYGPTALLAMMIALGMVQSVAVHRDNYSY